jgi:hypothetical protein
MEEKGAYHWMPVSLPLYALVLVVLGRRTQVADYLSHHQGIQFTHGVCQDCLRELYGDLYTEEELRALSTDPAPASRPLVGSRS